MYWNVRGILSRPRIIFSGYDFQGGRVDFRRKTGHMVENMNSQKELILKGTTVDWERAM